MIYKFLAASIVLAAYGDSGRSLRKKWVQFELKMPKAQMKGHVWREIPGSM
jgi:hypothetical protein